MSVYIFDQRGFGKDRAEHAARGCVSCSSSVGALEASEERFESIVGALGLDQERAGGGGMESAKSFFQYLSICSIIFPAAGSCAWFFRLIIQVRNFFTHASMVRMFPFLSEIGAPILVKCIHLVRTRSQGLLEFAVGLHQEILNTHPVGILSSQISQLRRLGSEYPGGE